MLGVKRFLSWRCAVPVTLALGAALGAAAARADDGPTAEGVEFFEKRVRPILVAECLECHGDKRKGGLQLDSRSAMLKGSDSGSVIKPGDPAGSSLIQAVTYVDEPRMPPDGKLSDDAIADLTAWIKMGAPWPAESGPQAAARHHDDAWKSHWAYQPVRHPELPQVTNTQWPRASIDYFVLAALEQRGLSPSADADRRAWLRRASYDVTGLPPTAEAVEQFVNDTASDAYGKQIDRLLASPHYGERWARHWLDIARYADTKGYLFTQDRSYPNAYKYRDWVVGAFNTDLPYDQFLIQQIAADRLPSADNRGALAAMGFLTVGRRFLGNPHDIIDDRLDVLMRGTMALTVTCARCHDHKYDPIPTADYYSLYGVLASTVEPAEPADLMTLADAPQPIVPHVFVRGNPGNPGPEVPRQFLGVLSGDSRQPFNQGSGRLELAQAIASPQNPLTARVIVNRVWMYYFDAPLVSSPSDFGVRSEAPSHPELLDFLASSLFDGGWSLKDLQRTILRSAVYRQSSVDRPQCHAVDPENRLLWRMNRKRLDFEALRDSLLAASGRMDQAIGGPAAELTATPAMRRRTIYGLIDRQNLPNLFRTFDFASPDTHSPARFTTTVPQQALFMLNSPFLADQVRSLASRQELTSIAEPRGRIVQLYRIVLGRSPEAQEIELGLSYWRDEDVRSADTDAKPPSEPKLSSWERYVQVLLLSNEFVYVD